MPKPEHQIETTALCRIIIIYVVSAIDAKSCNKSQEQVRRVEHLCHVYKLSKEST